MNLRDIEAQAKALAPILRDYVGKAVAALCESTEKRIDEIEQRFIARLDNLPLPKDGIDGIDGKDAEVITIDSIEKMVADAFERARQLQPVAQAGKDGRDALQIEILPCIERDKSYPRGTYAIAKGGLFRAYESTAGERGWECVLNGIFRHSIEQVDDRNIIVACEMSNGHIDRQKMALPAMIYRNVWKEGNYQKGDVVTFGGCAWHCNEDTDTKPGEGSKAWTLAVKKGRDGKST